MAGLAAAKTRSHRVAQLLGTCPAIRKDACIGDDSRTRDHRLRADHGKDQPLSSTRSSPRWNWRPTRDVGGVSEEATTVCSGWRGHLGINSGPTPLSSTTSAHRACASRPEAAGELRTSTRSGRSKTQRPDLRASGRHRTLVVLCSIPDAPERYRAESLVRTKTGSPNGPGATGVLSFCSGDEALRCFRTASQRVRAPWLR